MRARPELIAQRWQYKQNRGVGSFTIVRICPTGDRVTLRNARGKEKEISLRTLRGDYERIDNIGGAGS